MKKIIYTFILGAIVFTAKAQDTHFSQFNETPLLLNPAMTGTMQGDLRAILNYKDQWKALGSPYKTYAFSFDAALFKKNWNNAFLGAGLTFFNDKAGDNQLKTTQVNLSLSGIIKLNANNRLSAGALIGGAQKSLSSANMQWDNQFDGDGFNASYASGETSNYAYQFMFADVVTGLAYSFGSAETNMVSNDQFNGSIGVSYAHVNKPKQFQFNVEDRLASKLIVHGNARIGLQQTRLIIIPSFLYAQQSSTNEIVAGASFRYMITEGSRFTGKIKESALSLGCYYRWNDAFIPTFLFEMSHYAVGLSYDINNSSLRTGSKGRGGLEITLRFINPNPFGTQSSARFF